MEKNTLEHNLKNVLQVHICSILSANVYSFSLQGQTLVSLNLTAKNANSMTSSHP